MKKQILFSILGMLLLIGIVTAGTILSVDKTIDKTDKDLLQTIGLTNYNLIQYEEKGFVKIRISNDNLNINLIRNVGVIGDNETKIAERIKLIEDNFIKYQVKKIKENTTVIETRIVKEELVTLKESKIIGVIK